MAKNFTKHFSTLKEAENTVIGWGYQLDKSKASPSLFVYRKEDNDSHKVANVTKSHKGYKVVIETTLKPKQDADSK